MDPQATWTELLEALLQDEWPAAAHAAETLVEWLQRAGFAPQVMTHFPPEHPLHRSFVLAVCKCILQAADGPDAVS